MAHDIALHPITKDYMVANFVGQPDMWHQKETKPQICISLDDAKDALWANAYNLTDVAPLYAHLSDGSQTATGKNLVIESDGMYSIQHCETPKDNYQLMPASSVLDLMALTLDKFRSAGRLDAQMSCAMRLNQGRGIVWSIALGKVDFGGGDTGNYYLNFETGSDRKTRVWVSVIRSVCANTVEAGSRDAAILGRIATLELNNTGGTRLSRDEDGGKSILDLAVECSENVIAWIATYETLMKRLKQIPLPKGDAFSNLLKLTGLETGALKPTERRGRKSANAPAEVSDAIPMTDDIIQFLRDGGADTRSMADGQYGVNGKNLLAALAETRMEQLDFGIEDVANTGFGLVQAFTRLGTRKGDGIRSNSLISDWGNKVKVELLKLATV